MIRPTEKSIYRQFKRIGLLPSRVTVYRERDKDTGSMFHYVEIYVSNINEARMIIDSIVEKTGWRVYESFIHTKTEDFWAKYRFPFAYELSDIA